MKRTEINKKKAPALARAFRGSAEDYQGHEQDHIERVISIAQRGSRLRDFAKAARRQISR